MFGKNGKRVLELEKLAEYYRGIAKGLAHRVDQLVKQNDRLMDRFMATDFQTLQTFTLPEGSETETEYDQTLDEDLAGEILSGE